MSAKKILLALTTEQRERLEVVARSYRHSQRERQRAHILLLTDTNREGGSLPDTQIALSVGCQCLTVSKVRARAVERGVLESLTHKEQQNRKARRLDGEAEARLVAIVCSATPDGRKRWTMQILKEKLIELQIVESIDEATICRTLKKNALKPWLKKCWCTHAYTRASHLKVTRLSSARWRMCYTPTSAPSMPPAPWCP